MLNPIEGLDWSIQGLLAASLEVVGRTARANQLPAAAPPPPNGFAAGLCAGVRSLFSAAAHGVGGGAAAVSGPRFVRGKFDLAAIESGAVCFTPSTTTAAEGAYQGEQQQQGQGQERASPATLGVVALFLPRNTDLRQLACLVPEGKVWQVERSYLNGKLKGITFYCFAD